MRRFLEQRAPQRETPPDWCYVFDFKAPDKPRALKLPPGRASAFKKDIERLVEYLRTGLPGAFGTGEYRAPLQDIAAQSAKRRACRFSVTCLRASLNPAMYGNLKKIRPPPWLRMTRRRRPRLN